ncbi:bifunctional phosphopantothenoylcysteine decarboxylase/phosphopantothenate--cysteine ligase CoaBC [Verrucomicrobiaceae bacterium N1E253]|uniref:Bifunctional phosphopantothenoylcysteine decarboxylase/phosphopantothenate--cysteine ligase CoaBC n=1 Tax=Oceaniferula marina TaxID=2748318 RepID=A0A851GNA1_9BACT|nr:bifunctional phosphopantothenoylcysteine decarboxylase/phosphopantothenate--cysteine ligase CoaBC [Oceaniferula marina]NWK56310.1 bifunctional phosphopantothenoylcysteine decarboxylase/phosphopantothenate--cysteine ligase CoaBC [Oceaniferula marina]
MTILITAGPTREAIDPVRYLSNRSSGKMGYALAETAVKAGHRVILISGPTQLDLPDRVDYIPVESAAEMFSTVEHWIGKADIAIFAAAVADYRPAKVPEQKIKKNNEHMTLELVKNPDILGSARSQFNYEGVLIGFAAETENLETNARGKLERKGCDLVVANDVSRKDIGFDSNENEVLFVFKDRTEAPPKDSKQHLAHLIIEQAFELAENR